MKIFGFINPRAGVGKTTLVFNLGWVFAEAGFRVLLADLDPQGDLTDLAGATSLEGATVYDAIAPVLDGMGHMAKAVPHHLTERLGLLRGDMRLFHAEDLFAQAWLGTSTNGDHSRRVSSCIRELLQAAANDFDADIVLCDVGTNLGSVTRAVAWASDGLVVPLVVESTTRPLAELRQIEDTLHRWRGSSDAFGLLGYVAMRAAQRPVPALEGYRLLGIARAYPSLYSLALQAHKPILSLSPADGAIGSHQYAAREATAEHHVIATRIALTGGSFDESGLRVLIAEAIDEARTEGNVELELPFSAWVDQLSITHVDDAWLLNPGLRVRGSGVLEVAAVVDGGNDEGEPQKLAFVFDLELRRDRSLDTVHELTVESPLPTIRPDSTSR